MAKPTESNILNWKIWLAMPAIKTCMDDFSHRMQTRYHKDLDGMVTPEGDVLSLKDPAIDAFLDLMPFRLNDRFTFSNICMAFSRIPACERRSFNHFGYSRSKIEALVRLKDGGGWAQLDKLFMTGWGRTLSSFVDTVDLHVEPGDPGLGGEDCYRIGLYCPIDPDRHMLTIDWFAAASNLEHLVPLMKKVTEGKYPIKLRKYPDLPVAISQMAVFLGERELINVPAYRRADPSDSKNYSDSLNVDWSNSTLSSDSTAFVKAMADVASGHDGVHLKGQFLEESLGL